ncbi:endonuclease domain-containing protein [Rossellomorea vietnamensis]|uniref:endonuclease domain-containing protein n=1 Tax=Rossellomorea vietnamensis TaxID=218284 RepID=UPI00077C1E6D|nr:DUF559 domain-containing protein [Rossellomorea vietnamensis]
MTYQATELEIIMGEALFEKGFFFDEQVYVKKGNKHYEFDFVVYGDFCKVVVECDGPHHFQNHRWYKDLMRDLWTVTNDFQDVLRFNRSQIRNNIDGCLTEIQRSIEQLNTALKHDTQRKILLDSEKQKILMRKNSRFYKGKRPFSKYTGKKVYIPTKTPEDILYQEKVEFLQNSNKFHLNVNFSSNSSNSKIRLKDTTNHLEKDSGLIELEDGLKIPLEEEVYYRKVKALSIPDKKLLWFIIKNTTKDGFCVFVGKKDQIRSLINNQLLEVNYLYKSNKEEVSLIVLPFSPHMLKFYRSRV